MNWFFEGTTKLAKPLINLKKKQNINIIRAETKERKPEKRYFKIWRTMLCTNLSFCWQEKEGPKLWKKMATSEEYKWGMGSESGEELLSFFTQHIL